MTKILAVGMIILSMSTIGCSGCNDDKDNHAAQVRACMSSAACMMEANRLSAQYGGAIPYNVIQNPNPNILAGGVQGAPPQVPYKMNSVKKTITDQAIKDQSAKVHEEIQKYANNPKSSYYDPVQAVVPRSGDSDAGLPTQNDQVGLVPRSVSSDDSGGGVR